MGKEEKTKWSWRIGGFIASFLIGLILNTIVMVAVLPALFSGQPGG